MVVGGSETALFAQFWCSLCRCRGGLITDGSRLYFGEFSGDHFIVSQVSVVGGEDAAR